MAGTVVLGLFIPWVGFAKFFVVEGFVSSLAAFAASPQPSVYLYQPSVPSFLDTGVGPLLVLGESGLVAPLGPSLEPFSGERQGTVTYIVEEGDTSSRIAAQFGITLSTLLEANGLTERSIIRPGQELLILPVSGVRHEVKKGDTVGSIAKRYGAEVEDIINFNDLPASGNIVIGDSLIVPGGKLPAPAPVFRSYPRFTQPQLSSGYFAMPTIGRNFGRLHAFNGVDIANSCGTAVFASAGGTVSAADASGWNGGYGKYVRIKHPNGVETLYGHLQSVAVSAGAPIGQGDYIGEMGTTGRSSGCHVHFEVRGARNPFAR